MVKLCALIDGPMTRCNEERAKFLHFSKGDVAHSYYTFMQFSAFILSYTKLLVAGTSCNTQCDLLLYLYDFLLSYKKHFFAFEINMTLFPVSFFYFPHFQLFLIELSVL